MFKRLIKKLYFKAYPWAADITTIEVRDLSVEISQLKDNIRAYESQEILMTKLTPLCYEAIEFIPVEMIPTDTAEQNFEKFLRDNFARKLEPEIAKRFIINKDKGLSNPAMTAYRARIKFYVNDKEEA